MAGTAATVADLITAATEARTGTAATVEGMEETVVRNRRTGVIYKTDAFA